MAHVSKEWLSPQDLAELLQVPLPTIYKWNLKGTGPRVHRFGRHVRYSRADVEAFVSAHAQDRVPDAVA